MPQHPQPNFNAMRQDAVRRAREMQRRAAPPPPPEVPPPAPPEKPPPSPEVPPPAPPPAPPPSPLSGLAGLHPESLLHGLLTDWDAEKIAIAALLYLLYQDGADTGLLLALAYVLL